jgi:hypothetical protein
MIAFISSQQGRVVDFGNEKPQRLTRINRSNLRLRFGAGVTDAPNNGCTPPMKETDRIFGFALQITEENLMDTANWVPQGPFYCPNDAVCVSRYDRMKAIAPCDVMPGEPVYVALYSGMPARDGVLAIGCTWESVTAEGELGVIQINTRGVTRMAPPTDYLGKLQAKAFTATDIDDHTLRFYNLGGAEVAEIALPSSPPAPPAGIPVSTGEGWGESLDPDTVLRTGGGPDITGNLSVTAPGQITGTGVINIAAVMAGSFMATNEMRFREQTLIVDGFNTVLRSRFNDTGFIFSNCTVSFTPGATLLLAADPTLPLHAATKQYVDALEARVAALEATIATLSERMG